MKKIKFNLIAFLRNIGLKKETIKRIFKWKDGWRNEFCSEFEKMKDESDYLGKYNSYVSKRFTRTGSNKIVVDGKVVMKKMNNIQLFPHQVTALEQTNDFNRVAYYLDWNGSWKNICRLKKDDAAWKGFEYPGLSEVTDSNMDWTLWKILFRMSSDWHDSEKVITIFLG